MSADARTLLVVDDDAPFRERLVRAMPIVDTAPPGAPIMPPR